MGDSCRNPGRNSASRGPRRGTEQGGGPRRGAGSPPDRGVSGTASLTPPCLRVLPLTPLSHRLPLGPVRGWCGGGDRVRGATVDAARGQPSGHPPWGEGPDGDSPLTPSPSGGGPCGVSDATYPYPYLACLVALRDSLGVAAAVGLGPPACR